MSTNKNNDKITFKALFVALMKDAVPGALITDQSLQQLAAQNGLALSAGDIQNCVRQSEKAVGEAHSLRAVRIYKAGYRVYAGEDQYRKASQEGRDKMVSVIKKTHGRIKFVDKSKLPPDLRQAAVSKELALDSLLSISKGILARHNLDIKDVAAIESAAHDIKALEALKKAGL